MCGIAGFREFTAQRAENDLKQSIEAMTNVLTHRGPDGSGTWVDAKAGLAFGHRRLSIIDLSVEGAQPMVSHQGRYVITFNGEIYNFQEIRAELSSSHHNFHGHSDTEILLEAIAVWGLEATLAKCIGMFAFALWDRQTRTLSLVRDRMGVKPLYYAQIGERAFLFSSQSKSFLKHPYFTPAISLESTAGYLQFGYLPQSRSIYENAAQVPPGHILTVSPTGATALKRYWALPTHTESMDEQEALARLETLLDSSIKLRMRADVPVGSFLSGGIDSSLISALMQKHSSRPIKTFCIGFTNAQFNEAPYAKAIAQHLGTDHTEVIMEESELLSLVPKMGEYYDEPFADFSMLPTMLVSQTARQQVTVALSGDGGDELFAGYTRYVRANLLLKTPPVLSQCLYQIANHLPSPLLKRLGSLMGISLSPSRLRRLKDIAYRSNNKDMLLQFYKIWKNPLPLADVNYRERAGAHFAPYPLETVEDMSRMDAILYLPDDILTKVDRASMAYGLEAREPLLDHRLVEFAYSLPFDLKLRRGKTKHLLRSILYRQVPVALLERPKSGFSPPLHQWLRGPLRAWTEELLDQSKLEQSGFWDAARVRQVWQAHLQGEDHSFPLWAILMFQEWKNRYLT